MQQIGSGLSQNYIVRWYRFSPEEDTTEPPEHILLYFITRYWRRTKHQHGEEPKKCHARQNDLHWTNPKQLPFQEQQKSSFTFRRNHVQQSQTLRERYSRKCQYRRRTQMQFWPLIVAFFSAQIRKGKNVSQITHGSRHIGIIRNKYQTVGN